MKIDWFTFAAQIVNFLILLALLKRFLYGPILKQIAARETEIASRFDRASEERSAAEATKLGFEFRMEELSHTKQKLLAEAADEVERWKSEHISEAKAEVADSRADWFHELNRERQQLQDRLLEKYRTHALKLAEGVVGCLADSQGQSVVVDAFIRHLQKAEDTPRFAAGNHRGEAEHSTIVRSAFELSDAQQTEVRDALVVAGVHPARIQFRRDESLICGIEVRTEDHEVSWNARDSLSFLANEFSRELNELLAIPDELIADAEATHAT